MVCLDTVPAATLAELYRDPQYHHRGDRPWGYDDIHRHDREMVPVWDRALAAVGRRLGGRLLELGPGTGAFLEHARSRGWEAVAVDPYPSVDLTVPVVATIGAAAPFGPFDAVFLLDVLEHLPEPADVLSDIAGVLAPDGRVVIALPNLDGPSFRRQGVDWLEVKPPEHLSLPSAAGLKAAAAKAGLRPERLLPNFPLPWHWIAARNRVQGRWTRRSVYLVERLVGSLRKPRPVDHDYVTWVLAPTTTPGSTPLPAR